MASLRSVAQNVLDDCRDGIGWVAIWKEGRSWNGWAYYGVSGSDDGRVTIEDDSEFEELRSILEKDRNAILVNGYYTNLGDTTCMTVASLTDALRWQYGSQFFRLADAIEAAEYSRGCA